MDQPNQNDKHLPVYNIKAVSRQLGVLPVTLRAWERRYGLPTPTRGDQGYRLYSEYDLSTLRWIKRQMDSGMSIGRAVDYLHELRQNGRDPAYEVQPLPPTDQPASPEVLSEQLGRLLLRFDEPGALEVMRRAFALYHIDQVLTEIVQPSLVEIGEAWHRGEISIAAEHFATQFFMQNLLGMLSASIPPLHQGRIVAACAPGELHQIGLLMLVVMLRWRGWDVKYLGPDLSLERLEETLNTLHPRVLLFSATRPQAAAALERLQEVFDKLSKPLPVLVVGGQAFSEASLPESLGAVYLPGKPSEVVSAVEKMMGEIFNN